MAVFVTNLKRLRLIVQNERDDILNGIIVRKESKVIEFGDDCRFETDDKSEIDFLRKHHANAHNPKRTSTKFWELEFNKEDYEPKQKVSAKASP